MYHNPFRGLPAGLVALTLAACQQQADTPQVQQSETPPVTTPCEIVMGFDPWEPYHFTAADGTVRGIDVEIVSALAEARGCALSFRTGQWLELLGALRDGEVTVLAGATPVAERERYAWFSAPYRNEHFELFIPAGREVKAADFRDLLDSGFRLGLTDGYIYGEPLESLQAEPKYSAQWIYAAVAESNFTALNEGQIDGFLEDPYVAAAIIRRHGWQGQITRSGLTIGERPVNLMFSRKTTSAEEIEADNEILARLAENGDLQKIFSRYLDVGQ